MDALLVEVYGRPQARRRRPRVYKRPRARLPAPYQGGFHAYVPREDAEPRPTPNNAYLTTFTFTIGDQMNTTTVLPQGRYSLQQPHNYAYGRSKPHLRPPVPPDEPPDDMWNRNLGKGTAR